MAEDPIPDPVPDEAPKKAITRYGSDRGSKYGSKWDAPDEPAAVMSLGEHLNELRKRLIYAILGLVPIFATGLIFGTHLMDLLMTPMENALRNEGVNPRFMITSMFEAFSTWIMVAFLVTVIVGFPWILYQAWQFVAPGLYAHERRFAYLLVPLSMTLSGLGVLFMYFVALPAMLAFFIHFTTNLEQPDVGPAELPAGISIPSMPMLHGDPPSPAPGQMWFNETLGQLRMCIAVIDGKPVLRGVALEKATTVVQMPKLAEYLNQFVTFGILFAVAFQTPVVILLMGWIRLVTLEGLRRNRRMAIFIIAAISAVVTPPDPLSMMLLAVPLYVLFELGVFLLWQFPSAGGIGERKDKAKADPADHDRESGGAEA